MAINRIWQSGFELRLAAAENIYPGPGTTVFNFQDQNPKTGSRCLEISAQNTPYIIGSSSSQARIGFHIRHDATDDDFEFLKFSQVVTDTVVDILVLRFNGVADTLALYGADETELIESVHAGIFAIPDSFAHMGIDLKIDETNGWFYLWLDGSPLIEYDGDTARGASNFSRLGLTKRITFAYDDMYWDDTTGESEPARPPDLRFPLILPNGNGNYSEFLGNDGNSTDNYLLVDETVPNLDTDYVEGDAAGETDSYAMTSYTLRAGESIEAIIPTAFAKKQDALSALTLKNLVRLAGIDVLSDAHTLTTSFYGYSDRQTTKPGGGSWAQADLDGVEIGVELA